MEYCNNMIYLGRGNDDDDEDVIMILLCSVEIDVFVVEGIDGEERARVKGGEAATGPLAQYSQEQPQKYAQAGIIHVLYKPSRESLREGERTN